MDDSRSPADPAPVTRRRHGATVRLAATVASGRGVASAVLPRHREALDEAAGAPIHPGTLNLRLARPVRIVDATAWDGPDDGRSRHLAPAWLEGYPVHVNHWSGCPQHRLDVVADVHLRRHLGLRDGDRVVLQVPARHVGPSTLGGRLRWRGAQAMAAVRRLGRGDFRPETSP
jgi:CTP-dependent riboflavin kinase